MSDKITEQKILSSLSDVNLPLENGDFSGKNIVEAKAVSGIAIKDGNVIFTIEISPSISAHADALRTTAEQAVHAIDGVLSVTAIVTAHREAGTQPSPTPMLVMATLTATLMIMLAHRQGLSRWHHLPRIL